MSNNHQNLETASKNEESKGIFNPKTNTFIDDNTLIKIQPAKSTTNFNQPLKSETGDNMSLLDPNNIATPSPARSSKFIPGNSPSKKSSKLVSVSKVKEKQAINKKFHAMKMMFVELDSRVENMAKRLEEMEYTDKLIANATEESALNTGSAVQSKGSLMMQTEFTGVKHLIGRQQLSLKKIENVIKQINEWKNDINLSKIYEEQKNDLEILKKYIEEVNDYNSKMYKNTESKSSKYANLMFL